MSEKPDQKILTSIIQVRMQLPSIKKSGTGMNHGLQYTDILQELNTLLDAYFIAIYPQKIEIVENDKMNIVHVNYRFVSAEDESFIEVQTMGEGNKGSGKGISAAQTQSFKKALIQTFQIRGIE
jgi:hypothetical protein